MTMNNIATLPTLADLSNAKLPMAYETAQKAIAECARIDECKGWADKAAALASYARQAKDDSLRVMAVRIQARAQRRCGELLKQIPAHPGGRPTKNAGKHPPEFTRTVAANNAGLSEHQRKTALRVASVPADDFNSRVESPSPPSIVELANLGKTARPANGLPKPMKLPLVAIDAYDTMSAFSYFCLQHDPTEVALQIPPAMGELIRQCVTTVDDWLDRLVANLPESQARHVE